MCDPPSRALHDLRTASDSLTFLAVTRERSSTIALAVVVAGSGKAAAINVAAAVCSTSPNRRRIYRYGATD